jgi:hypothetical protein
MSNSDSPHVQSGSQHDIVEKIVREAKEFYERGNVLLETGLRLETGLSEARQQWLLARQKYEEGLQYVPDSARLMNCLVTLLNEEAGRLESDYLPEAIPNWQHALKLCSRLTMLQPDNYETWVNWGNTLHQQAHGFSMTDMPMARESWYLACQKYAHAFTLDPTQLLILLNWADSLADDALAEVLWQQNYDVATEKWLQAEQKFAQLCEADPNFPNLTEQWCIQLLARAEALAEHQHDMEHVMHLRAKALEKIKQGLFFDPKNATVLHIWANMLGDQASELSDTDPEQAFLLWQQAIDKLREILHLEPESIGGLIGITLAMVFQSKLTTDPLLLHEIHDQYWFYRKQLWRLSPNLNARENPNAVPPESKLHLH